MITITIKIEKHGVSGAQMEIFREINDANDAEKAVAVIVDRCLKHSTDFITNSVDAFESNKKQNN